MLKLPTHSGFHDLFNYSTWIISSPAHLLPVLLKGSAAEAKTTAL
jgi:hypothetical protein